MQQHKHSLLSVGNIHKQYNTFTVLKDVSFTVRYGEKIGLVGANGAGKSTLLRIVAGDIQPDSGRVEFARKGIKVGYIPQNFSEDEDRTVCAFIEDAAQGAFQNHSLVQSKLALFGFDDSVLQRSLGSLSGGEASRVALLRISLIDADLYLLDEPTNNLDLEALRRLEEFVTESNKSFIIVSHDRRFLDETVSKIIEIDDHKRDATIYDGNFTSYREVRARRIENQWREYHEGVRSSRRLKKSADEKINWMRRIERTRKDIRKLDRHESEKPVAAVLRDKEARMGIRSKVIRDRYEQKLESASGRPFETLPLKISFQPEHRSGAKVFEAIGITKDLGDKTLGPIDLSLYYGDRILITGANGAGKSTLLKILNHEVLPDGGSVERGERVVVGTLPQVSELQGDKTIVEVFSEHSDIPESEARKILNRFKLSSDDASRVIGELSDGERSRVILATLVARGANCLILDEPSNHLDIEAIEELEQALAEYSGTLIVVSHDRYFIEKIQPSKVYRLERGSLRSVPLSSVI